MLPHHFFFDWPLGYRFQSSMAVISIVIGNHMIARVRIIEPQTERVQHLTLQPAPCPQLLPSGDAPWAPWPSKLEVIVDYLTKSCQFYSRNVSWICSFPLVPQFRHPALLSLTKIPIIFQFFPLSWFHLSPVFSSYEIVNKTLTLKDAPRPPNKVHSTQHALYNLALFLSSAPYYK